MHRQTMQSFLFAGGIFLDPRRDSLCDGVELPVEDGPINEISPRSGRVQSAACINRHERTLMPALIGAQIHLVLTEMHRHVPDERLLTPLAANGSVAMRAIMLGDRFVRHAL